ncbi:poly(ethylene terephthalate) hydrolase family protein [Sphingobacterium populi]|nr:adenylate cyclase [Sphingobacterium sp. CFCC 11742]
MSIRYADRRITEIFYPSDIQSLENVPVISFVGGLLSNAANYDALINLWTSYGFIVVNSNNFINFSPTLHFTGIQQLVAENNDPSSPLYNKADLSKILVSGHSAGGGGALLISSSLVRPFLRAVDPNINIAGSFPMQASFNATGLTVDAPTLILTGQNDLTVIPYLQGLLTQYNLISRSPAWYICTRNSTHLTPTVELARNDYAGITVAFIRFLGQNNRDAARYFVGTPYRATQDPAFIQASTSIIPTPTHPIRVQRNNPANLLPTPATTETTATSIPFE